MNDYLTPRRRHSSLFQRMEDEINKISKKLSAAKQHKQNHANPISNSAQSEHHTRYASNRSRKMQLEEPVQQPDQTVRRHNKEEYDSKEITKKITYLRDRTNETSTRLPIRRLRFGQQLKIQDIENSHNHHEESKANQLTKLSHQNRNLQNQLQKMKAICEQQSFKLGYLRAESRQNQKQIQSERQQYRKQQLYLSKLLQSYKLKVDKYKQILDEDQSIQISIQDL